MSRQFNSESKPPYRGRFAPSPSGPLHFGSLVCALASYLDAKANGGQWLLRMEDIDPPREQKGASESILQTLRMHNLYWDDALLFQSTRSETYLQHLSFLLDSKLAYHCNCTRKRLASLNGKYDGRCLRSPPLENHQCAIRLNTSECLNLVSDETTFLDLIQGEQKNTVAEAGDFIVHRKDGLFAYQLAVVVDDIYQGITRVVRGRDLLDTTAQQRLLYKVFDKAIPEFAHIPVLVDKKGNKLSKQNHARPVDDHQSANNIRDALNILGLKVPDSLPLENTALLEWGAANWNLHTLYQCSSIPAPSHTM